MTQRKGRRELGEKIMSNIYSVTWADGNFARTAAVVAVRGEGREVFMRKMHENSSQCFERIDAKRAASLKSAGHLVAYYTGTGERLA